MSHMEHAITTPQRLAEVIVERMRTGELSLREASRRTNIPVTTLSRRLNGSSPFLSTELAAFADLFGVPVSRLALEAESLPLGADIRGGAA